jgi:hypothetical protein
MWKIAASSTFALLVACATPLGSAIAQAPQPAAPAAQPPAATSPPKAATPEKTAAPRRRVRHAARHKWRRHAAFRCFGSEWRAFPTRDPNGYFYAPGRGGIC